MVTHARVLPAFCDTLINQDSERQFILIINAWAGLHETCSITLGVKVAYALVLAASASIRSASVAATLHAGIIIAIHKNDPQVAPHRGPTHQSQWLSQLSATREGPKLRVGLMEQPVIGMRTTCAINTAKPMGKGARLNWPEDNKRIKSKKEIWVSDAQQKSAAEDGPSQRRQMKLTFIVVTNEAVLVVLNEN